MMIVIVQILEFMTQLGHGLLLPKRDGHIRWHGGEPHYLFWGAKA